MDWKNRGLAVENPWRNAPRSRSFVGDGCVFFWGLAVVPKGKFGTSSTPKVPDDLGEEMYAFTGRVYVFLPDAPKIHFVKWIK